MNHDQTLCRLMCCVFLYIHYCNSVLYILFHLKVGDGELTVTQEEEREKGDEVEVEGSEEDEDDYED